MTWSLLPGNMCWMALPQPPSDKPNHCAHVVKPACVGRREQEFSLFGRVDQAVPSCHSSACLPTTSKCFQDHTPSFPIFCFKDILNKKSHLCSNCTQGFFLHAFVSWCLKVADVISCGKKTASESQDLQEHPKPARKQGETSMSADECNALSIQQTATIVCPLNLDKCQAY